MRYLAESLRGDYMRGLAGLALTVTPLASLPVHPVIAGLLGIAAVLFAYFTLRTLQRQMSEFDLTEEALVQKGPMGRSIRWAEIAQLRLRYYSTRRDRERGWMHLTVRGAGKAIRLESTLEGFDAIAERAAEAADNNGVEFDTATENNLAAIGVVTRPGELAQRWGLEGEGPGDGARTDGPAG